MQDIQSIFDKIIESGLIFLIFFTPLAFGTVHVWAYTVMELTVFFLLLIWLLKTLVISHESRVRSQNDPRLQTPDSRLTFVRTSLNLPLLLYLGLILFQMAPLPPSLLKHLSPNTYTLYQQTLPGWPEGRQETVLNSTNSRNSMNSVDSRLQPRAWKPLSIYSHATRTELFKLLAYGGIFFLIINTIRNRAQIRRLVRVIIIAGACVAVLGIMQMATGTDKIYWFWQSHLKTGGYFGPYVNPNHFANYMGMVIPLTIGFLLSQHSPFINQELPSWRSRFSSLDSWLSTRVLLVFVTMLMIASLFFTLSRGGIITFSFSMFFLSILLFSARRKRKRSISFLITILSISIFLLIWMGIDPVLKELSTLLNLQKASSGRLTVSKDALSIAKDFPMFGVGLGNFQYLYPKYKTIKSHLFWVHAENDYAEMLSDTGILGLLLFFGGILFFLITIIRKWRDRKDPFMVGITLGGVTGVVATLLHSVVEFNFHVPANATLLFIILGLITATIHLKVRGKQEYSLLPSRTYDLKPKMKMLFYPLTVLLILGLSTTVIRTYLASRHYQYFINAKIQDSRYTMHDSELPTPDSRLPTPDPMNLTKAVSLDSANATYHYELGQYYSNRLNESLKEGVWKLCKGKWFFDFDKKTVDYGLLTLDYFSQAINLQPTNGWYHLCLGWILSQLSQLNSMNLSREMSERLSNRYPVNSTDSVSSINSKNSIHPLNPDTHFDLALLFDPTNSLIKDYIARWRSRTRTSDG